MPWKQYRGLIPTADSVAVRAGGCCTAVWSLACTTGTCHTKQHAAILVEIPVEEAV